jgi:hypothetical protein
MLWMWIGGAVLVLLVIRWSLRSRGTAGRGSQGDLDGKIRDTRTRAEGRGAEYL